MRRSQLPKSRTCSRRSACPAPPRARRAEWSRPPCTRARDARTTVARARKVIGLHERAALPHHHHLHARASPRRAAAVVPRDLRDTTSNSLLFLPDDELLVPVAAAVERLHVEHVAARAAVRAAAGTTSCGSTRSRRRTPSCSASRRTARAARSTTGSCGRARAGAARASPRARRSGRLRPTPFSRRGPRRYLRPLRGPADAGDGGARSRSRRALGPRASGPKVRASSRSRLLRRTHRACWSGWMPARSAFSALTPGGSNGTVAGARRRRLRARDDAPARSSRPRAAGRSRAVELSRRAPTGWPSDLGGAVEPQQRLSAVGLPNESNVNSTSSPAGDLLLAAADLGDRVVQRVAPVAELAGSCASAPMRSTTKSWKSRSTTLPSRPAIGGVVERRRHRSVRAEDSRRGCVPSHGCGPSPLSIASRRSSPAPSKIVEDDPSTRRFTVTGAACAVAQASSATSTARRPNPEGHL